MRRDLVKMSHAFKNAQTIAPFDLDITDERRFVMTDDITPAPLLIYFRCRPSEPEASATVMDQQQVNFAAWLSRQTPAPAISSEITESEDDTFARPALARAIRCVRRGERR